MGVKQFNIIDDVNIDLDFAGEKGFNVSKLNTCLQCGTCSSSCPTYFAMDVSPRKLWRMLALGLKEEIRQSDTFWLLFRMEELFHMKPAIQQLSDYWQAQHPGLNPLALILFLSVIFHERQTSSH